jgi:hypothetical protein
MRCMRLTRAIAFGSGSLSRYGEPLVVRYGSILVDVGAARVLVVLVAVGLIAYLGHLSMLAMERRGWVYYRTKGTGSMGAAALFSLNEVFHPEGRHTVVEQQEQNLRGARRQAPGGRPTDEEPQADE